MGKKYDVDKSKINLNLKEIIATSYRVIAILN